MRQDLIAVCALLLSLAASSVTAEEEINYVHINRIYIDPSDIVVLTDTGNGCGSNFFHLSRSNGNFKEMHAYMFLAFKNGDPINLTLYDGCSGDRRFISHGSIEAQ